MVGSNTGGCNMQCDYCVYNVHDELEGYSECQVNIDEDELVRFMSGSYKDCPYFRMDDEYKVVRKQM